MLHLPQETKKHNLFIQKPTIPTVIQVWKMKTRPVYILQSESESESHLAVSDCLQPHGL